MERVIRIENRLVSDVLNEIYALLCLLVLIKKKNPSAAYGEHIIKALSLFFLYLLHIFENRDVIEGESGNQTSIIYDKEATEFCVIIWRDPVISTIR